MLSRSLPSRERGLKRYRGDPGKSVWKSLPSRERGLKPSILIVLIFLNLSLPSRERGLKQCAILWQVWRTRVASFTGAWIETSWKGGPGLLGLVASFTGAWIETMHFLLACALPRTSLPSRERGLKRAPCLGAGQEPRSLPSRERGLKQFNRPAGGIAQVDVASFTGAWIETILPPWHTHGRHMSLPSRERGLKLNQAASAPSLPEGRFLHGSVD